jgi:alpha-L-rhamnosidase
MHAWVSKGITRDAATNLWDFTLRQLGDWLDPAAPANNAEGGQTDSVLVANAFLINTTDLMSKINTVLHKPADAQYYATQAAQLRQAFQTEYITPSGRLVSDSQTAFALAIHFSLLTPTQLAHAGARLATVVRTKSQFKISTGFAGTPLIGHALSATGQDQLFYRMLTETQCPSWLYPVTMGATTIWERWDSMRPDGSVNDPGMTSFNHYALGAVANWMHKNIGGLAPLAPGWKRFLVRPVPGGGLTSSAARFESPYGRIQVKWWLSGSGSGQAGDMVMACLVTVPPNTSARVELPGQDVWEVGCGKYDFRVGYRMP